MKANKKTSLMAFSVRLFRLASAVKKQIIGSTFASIIGNVAQLTLMGCGAAFILSVAGFITGSPVLYASLTFLSAVLIVVGRYVEGYVSHVGAYRLLADLRVGMFRDIRRLAPACLVDRNSGDLLSIAIADIETLEFFFGHTIGPLFTVILLPVCTLILAWTCDSKYVLVLLPVYIIISVVLPVLALKLGRKIGQRYRKEVAEYQTLVLESVYGLRDIQIFGHGARRKALLDSKNSQINKTFHLRTLHKQLVTSAPTFFIYLARILIIGVATTLALKGNYNPAGVVILSFVVSASFSSTQSLTAVISNLIETYAAAERLFAIQDAQPEVIEKPDSIKMPSVEDIEFKDLCFSYGEDLPELLKDVNLHISRGEKIGIMGESGIGKSTIIRLLLRFWEPTSGKILINGTPLTDFTLSSLHEKVALLEQDTFLFNCTIAENIALGKPGATREEIINAAKMASIHDFIETLPDGYDTQMGEMGDRLSGGERQRIGIARTLLMDPDVLVLDEPTSSLDILNEKSFLKTLDDTCRDKTIIVVSHRMSTLSSCSRIFTLKDGHLVEK